MQKLKQKNTNRQASELDRQQLLKILQVSLNEIYTFDAKTLHFQYVNERALDNLGYSLEQMRQMTPLNLKPEINKASFDKLIFPLLSREREKLEFKTVHKRIDGSVYPVEIHLQLMERNGKLVFLAVILDLTERQRAEARLRQKEARYQMLSRATNDAIWDWDLVKDEIEWNEGIKTHFGYKAEQIEPTAIWWFDRIHPEDRERVAREVDEFMEGGGEIWSGEYRYRKADDSYAMVVDRGFVIKNENGNPVRMLGSMIDITERKRTEIELRQSEARYRSLVLATSQIIWISDSRGVVNSDLPSWREYTGQSVEEIQGYGWMSAIHPDDHKSTAKVITEAIANKDRYYQVEYRILGKDGNYRYFLSRSVPVLAEDGEVREWIGTCTDIHDRKLAEQALHRSEERYRSLVIATSQIVWTTDAEGQVIDIPHWRNYTGQTVEEVQGLGWVNALHPDDRTRSGQIWIHAVKTKSFYETEYRIRGKDGSYRYFAARGVPVLNEDGSIREWVGLCTDIHDRKLAEEERQKLAMLIENSSDFIAMASMEGQPIFINAAGLKLVGLGSMEESRTKHIFDFVMPEELPKFQQKIIQAVFEKGSWQSETEFRHFQTDEAIPVDYNMFTLNSPETGQPIAMATITRDIRERKQTEAAEKKARKERDRFFNLSQDIVGTAGFDGYYKQLNPASENILGFSIGELQATPFIEFVHPEDREATLAEAEKVATGAKTFWFENRVLCKDGSYKCLMWQAVPLVEEQIMYVVGRDITERKRQEEALQQKTHELEQTLVELQQTQSQLLQTEKMSSLGQLVAGVAHEINNPVNFIYGNLVHASQYTQDLLNLLELYQQHYPNPAAEIESEIEAVELDFLSEDLPKLLSSMKVGADRIRAIVLSLRNFSRLDEAEMKAVDIHEGIDNTLLILQNRLKAKPEHPAIEIIKEYDNLPLVECYAGQLNQVFMNILTNAIDALDEYNSKRTLEQIKQDQAQIKIQTRADAKNKLVIRIADNGSGMSEATRKRLFDPFFTTKPVGKGTGLGLAISYQIIVEKHGGKLECISSPGKGCEFIISIPIRQEREFTERSGYK